MQRVKRYLPLKLRVCKLHLKRKPLGVAFKRPLNINHLYFFRILLDSLGAQLNDH
jgi:hypothetical protein